MKRPIAGLMALSLFVAITGYMPKASAYQVLKCNGKTVKWQSSKIPVRMRSASVSFPSGAWRNALIEAVNSWNRNPSKFSFSLSHNDSSVRRQNGQNEIWFTSDDNLLNGAPAWAYWWFNCPNITEVDIVFDNRVSYTTSTSKSVLWPYGGSSRPFQTTAMHELGHALILLHENRYYNIMGQDWDHIHANGSTARAYAGEDASHGAVFLYGVRSPQRQDVAVVHWKRSGSSGEYSTHRRTQMYNSSGSLLSSFTSSGEPVYRVNKGQRVQVEFTYENNGASTQNPRVGFYISTNNIISTLDTKIGDVPYTLGRNTPYTARNSVTIPSNLTPGRYYIGAIVDNNNSIGEINETNNATYIAIQVN
ncbi:CARDB domain-containing protein [Moorena sp. SIO4G3]|uniref:CARDB domain-containing protein n=1 Tax=Moorena sp. SIO4G3 TaxID=2607821 RepID=UPI0025F2D101|nr:CARDB domain-containing protein [Moorena sp. SIO4G3]